MRNTFRAWLVMFLVFGTTPFAWGGIDSGGGDAAEIEFINIGRGISAALRATKVELGIDLDVYDLAVEDAKVEMVRYPLLLDGRPRDAINYPSEKRIQVFRNSWVLLPPVSKVELTFHEFLGLAGLERDSYEISSKLVLALGRDKLVSIAATAAPDVTYSCEFKYKNVLGLVFYPCGVPVAELSTKDNNKKLFLGKHCERVFAAIARQDISNGIIGYPESMSGTAFYLGKKSKKSHGWTGTDAQSAFILDIYSAPIQFQISLAATARGIFGKQEEFYFASCKRK